MVMTSFWPDGTDRRFMEQLKTVKARPDRSPKTMTMAFSSGSTLLSGIYQHESPIYSAISAVTPTPTSCCHPIWKPRLQLLKDSMWHTGVSAFTTTPPHPPAPQSGTHDLPVTHPMPAQSQRFQKLVTGRKEGRAWGVPGRMGNKIWGPSPQGHSSSDCPWVSDEWSRCNQLLNPLQTHHPLLYKELLGGCPRVIWIHFPSHLLLHSPIQTEERVGLKPGVQCLRQGLGLISDFMLCVLY